MRWLLDTATLGILALLHALSSYAGSGSTTLLIDGNLHQYEIPSSLLREPSAILYSDAIDGDDEGIVSLIVDEEEMRNFPIGPGREMSILLFTVNQGDLKEAARRRIAGAKLSAESMDSRAYHHYEKRIGDHSKSFYVTFDAYDDEYLLSADDYIAEILRAPPLVVGDSVREAQATCAVWSIYDGILVQLGAIGALCDPAHFNSMQSALHGLLSKWRR